MITSDTQLAFIVRSVFILFKLNDRFTHYLIEIKCFLSYRKKWWICLFLLKLNGWLSFIWLKNWLIYIHSSNIKGIFSLLKHKDNFNFISRRYYTSLYHNYNPGLRTECTTYTMSYLLLKFTNNKWTWIMWEKQKTKQTMNLASYMKNVNRLL